MNAGEVLQLRIEKDESPASKASSQTTEKPSLTTGFLITNTENYKIRILKTFILNYQISRCSFCATNR